MINHYSYGDHMNSRGHDGLGSASEEDYPHSLYSSSSLLPSMISHYSSQTDNSIGDQSQHLDSGSLTTPRLEQPRQTNAMSWPCLVYDGLKNEGKRDHPCRHKKFSDPLSLLFVPKVSVDPLQLLINTNDRDHLQSEHIRFCCPPCYQSRIQTDPAKMNPVDWKRIFFNSREGVMYVASF
jgi:hypothetical protein